MRVVRFRVLSAGRALHPISSAAMCGRSLQDEPRASTSCGHDCWFKTDYRDWWVQRPFCRTMCSMASCTDDSMRRKASTRLTDPLSSVDALYRRDPRCCRRRGRDAASMAWQGATARRRGHGKHRQEGVQECRAKGNCNSLLLFAHQRLEIS